MIITASIMALILAGVLAGLAACQVGMEDSLPLPPAVPYARIVQVNGGPKVLEWYTVYAARKSARRLSASFDITVGGLPTLEVFVTETRTVSGIGPLEGNYSEENSNTDRIPRWPPASPLAADFTLAP